MSSGGCVGLGVALLLWLSQVLPGEPALDVDVVAKPRVEQQRNDAAAEQAPDRRSLTDVVGGGQGGEEGADDVVIQRQLPRAVDHGDQKDREPVPLPPLVKAVE